MESRKLEPESHLLLQAQRFRVMRLTRTLGDGKSHAHDVIIHPGAVVILPLIAPDRVCLIRNFRMAVNETLVELPAGTIDPDEDPLETAKRELIEETGYRAKHWKKLVAFYPSPGFVAEKMTIFLATGLTAGEATPMDDERIETRWYPRKELAAMIRAGKIEDAKTIIGFYTWNSR
jgi:ADP-ribose pyrophosphatase